MTEPRWLDPSYVVAIQADQFRSHGGAAGIRDRGLLDSALARAKNLFAHDPDADLAALAAAYGLGIARNHPFVDGNKRVSFQAMYLFLGLNGLRIEAPEEEVVLLTIGVASGDVDEAELAAWLREHT